MRFSAARSGTAARRALAVALLLWPNAWLLAVSAEPFSWLDRALLLGIAALFVALPLAWARSPRAFWFWNLPVACMAGVYGAYVVYFKAPPYAGLWGAIRATTARELYELALQFRFAALASVASVLVYVALARTESTQPLRRHRRAGSLALGAAAWVALCVVGIPTLWAFPDIRYLRPVREEVFLSSFPPGTLVQAAKSMWIADSAVAAPLPPVAYHATPGREIYVQIVGESEQYVLWARQLAVSGAALRDDAGTILFRENMAQANLTHLALPLMLTGSALPRVARGLPTWLDYARARGCRTGWLAANEFDGQRLYRHALDFVYDLHALTRGIDADIYDDMMLPEFRRILAQGPEKVCLLVHMNGSHMDYRRRYRPEQARYPVDGVADSDRVAYENSLLKSIAFVDAMIAELARLPQARSFLVYAPDHGENLREDARQFISHSHNPPSLYEARVPLVVWGSPAFRRQNPRQWAAMQANAGVPTSSRSIFPTLLWALGIDPPPGEAPALFDDARVLRALHRTIAVSDDLVVGEEAVR